ncbi:unnamed protein product, partial [Sphagnum tenellum]
ISNKNTRKVIIISTIVSGSVLALVIAITICLFWKSRQRQRYLLLQLHERFAQHEVQPTIFGYTELKAATRDFHPTMKLGEGSFGVVYKGIFANEVEVAIKQLFVKTQKNIDEFLNEVVIISGVKHRNLVKLKGCCLRDNKRLLVYEYLENGDLANLLFGGQNNREVLFWPTRFNICLGIARGLHYLHDICQPRIIHRDIKASNILLDKKLQPKIADFGLAFLFPDDKSYINTMHVAGTRGYLAPEYATRGLLTTKVDVYSFGVLLLEIISGRKNIDHNLPQEDIYLVEKAWRLHREGNLIDIVDQNLHLLNDETIQAQRLLNITLLCLLNDGEKRPSMARVVAMLQGDVESEIVENDLALGRSSRKLPLSSLFSLESKLERSNISEGSETSSLVVHECHFTCAMSSPCHTMHVILDDASIVGTLPPEIGDLQNLAILDLSGNQLTGDIPNLGGLTWLQTLKLSGNQLYGPAPAFLDSITSQGLANLTALTTLSLSGCGLSGAFPYQLASLLRLQNIILDDASIVGTLPPAIGGLTNLAILDLSGNQLTGPIPNFGSMTALQTLKLSGNQLSGPSPVFLDSSTSNGLANLTFLTTLDLSNNLMLSGSPPDLTTMPMLQYLDLSGNQLTGPIPNFGGMLWLDTLKLSGNQLSGPSPVFFDSSSSTGLVNLTYLTTLDLSNNLMLSGSPPDLTTMPMLQYLNLSMNKFSGAIDPASIFNPASNLKVLDLSQNNFSGPLPNISLFSTSLQQLDLSYNRFNSPQVPTWLSGFNQLQTLALSGCGLIGSFPYQLANSLPQLQTMNLDNNNFNGTLYIGNISSLSRKLTNSSIDGHLQSLNLTKTDISYVDYNSSDIIDVTTTIILENSTYCLEKPLQTNGQRCYCAQNCFVIPDTSNNTRKVIIISTIVSGIVLALVIAITTCLFWRSRQRQRYLLLQLHERFAQHEVQPTIFGYVELKVATRDFHPTMKLGEGSFGVVYKGIFANGVEVAIKQLFVKNQKNIDEFLNEVVIISGVKHRNLVKLKGCCLRDNKRLLVYEYLENGDLANLLFGGQNNREVLFWPTRFNICLGIARGLHYLHDICQPRIIHRDIKASNILLDKKLQPKIADFGLAFLFPDDKTHISTMHVAGTRGYLAPEYATRGQLTTKVDVYSFGVLLLEIISGRKNIDHNLPLEDIYLVEKAWRLHRESNLIDIVDQNLHLLNDETIQAQRLLNITLLCLLNDGEKRPSMARVVAMLQGEVESEIVENDLALGRSSIKLPLSSLSSLESKLELSNISEGSETSSLVFYNHSNASMNATSSNLSSIELSIPKWGSCILGRCRKSGNHSKEDLARSGYKPYDGMTIIIPILALNFHLGKEYFAYAMSTPTSPPPQAPTSQPLFLLLLACDNNKKNIEVILISTLVSGSIVTLVIVITIYLFWRNKRKQQYLLLQIQEKFAEFEVQPTIFGYNELKVATRDFHPTMKLGEGSFGVVYKGILANGIEVAIKQLLIKSQQNIDEFLNEVVIITGVKHRNLVKLKGCCLRDNKRLLVYEYLENGDLAKVLFERNGVDISFWPTRFNICLGIAHGLFYLHEIAEPRIIHRDIKASNILLDKRLQPKIADFGLALLFADDKTHISTMHVAGTRGYLAPEYATCGQLTIKADVYSFGVLILEIISGRKCIDNELPPNDTYLIEKAWRLHNEGNLIDIIDQTLHLCNDEMIQARQLLNIALLCLLHEGEKRPSMAHVMAMLQGEVELERVENELKLGKSVIKSIKTSFSTIRSTIEISSTSEGLESNSQLLSNDSNISVNQKNLNLSSMELNLVSSTRWNTNT